MSSTNNNSLDPDKPPTKWCTWSGSKLFWHYHGIPETIIFRNNWFWKNQKTTKNSKEFELFACQWQLLPSTDNLCKQFGPRSGPTKFQALSCSKLFDTIMVFLKEFSKKNDFEKKQNSRPQIKSLPSRQWRLLPSTDTVCKQFRPKSGLTKQC